MGGCSHAKAPLSPGTILQVQPSRKAVSQRWRLEAEIQTEVMRMEVMRMEMGEGGDRDGGGMKMGGWGWR